MADEADIAQQTTEQLLELQLKRRIVDRREPTGYCFNCDEKLPHPKVYCDADCRDDFENRERLSLQNGRSA